MRISEKIQWIISTHGAVLLDAATTMVRMNDSSHAGGTNPWDPQRPTEPTAQFASQPARTPAAPAQPYQPTVPQYSTSQQLPVEQPARSRGRGGLVAGAVALALVSGLTGGVTATYLTGSGSTTSTAATSSVLNEAVSASTTAAAAPEGSAQAVAAAVLPSVVSVTVVTSSGQGQGSGVVLSSDGLIMTNNHVIEGAQQMQVQLNDGRTFPAELVAADAVTDIGVIRVEGVDDLTPITLGNSDAAQVGQSVVAVGNPLGLSGTVTEGIISALNRPVRATGEAGNQDTVIAAIQTDAAINPGNSGGALVNLQGELIGINTVIASMPTSSGGSAGSIGLGFAIPINQARLIADQLIQNGEVTFAALGVSLPRTERVVGAELAEVTPGGAADAAGLTAGDVVTHFNGARINSADALIAAIRARTVGEQVTLTVTDLNGENARDVEVTLQSQ